MDLEVVGRHALLFDDDSMAEFVNSPGALVDWHSLSIDRYDVRHLLSGPPPPRSLRRRHPVDDESELDRERYLDLEAALDAQDSERGGTGSENTGGYNAVSFSYGNLGETTDPNIADAEPCFRPPFSVPENLLQHLPLTEKVHQIIARTATFVSKHGGQSEIVLRVKQGNNPTFGFLMPDHELHPYFRFLVDHQGLIMAGTDGNPVDEEGKDHRGLVQAGGSLSLLGSVYGSVEDEEGRTEAAPPLAENNKADAPVADNLDGFGGSVPKRIETSKKDEAASKKDEAVSKGPVTLSKERKTRLPSTIKAATMAAPKKESNLFSSNTTSEKLQASALSSISKIEAFVLEPSSDMKRVVDKIVEFILRNGREFEAVLVQQDSKHGRFPFLIPSNPYHPYYLKVLQKAQESQSGDKGLSEKYESLRQRGNRKSDSNTSNSTPTATDIPHDSDRKEKFKMVIGKLKKDGQDSSSKATQSESGFRVDTAAAAAILQAATRGIKYPNLSLLSKASVNGTSQGLSSEERGPSGSNSLHSSQSQAIPKPGVSAPVAKVIAKTVAVAAASEADSSEASLTKEQKLKAERLKRAKLFAAMIKTGAAPSKDDQLRALSVEPHDSGCSGSGAETMNVIGREREGSSIPQVGDNSEIIEKIDNEEFVDVHNERRSKRSYRSRSIRGEVDEDEDAGTEVGGETKLEEDGRNHKHSRKKRRSHHSSHCSRDRHKRRRHSSSKDKDSRSRHKYSSTSKDEHLQKDASSEDEHGHYENCKQVSSSGDEDNRRSRHRKKHHVHSDDEHRHSKRRHDSPSIDERHSRHKRRHHSSSDDEHHHSRSRHEDGSSSDTKHQHARRGKKHGKPPADEYQHKANSTKHGRKPQSEKEADLEEGEILAKSEQSRASEGNDNPSRETSVNLSRASQDVSAGKPPQPLESTEISDDFRAKIRAMLMATM